MIGIYSLGPIGFRPLSLITWVYLGAAAISVSVGYGIGLRLTGSPPPIKIGDGLFKTTTLISLIGTIGVAVDYWRSGFSLAQTLNDPALNRMIQKDATTSVLTTIAFPIGVLAWSCLIVAWIRLKRAPADIWFYIASAAVTILIIADVLQSGRGGFLRAAILLICFVVVDLSSRGRKTIHNLRNLKRKLLYVAVAFAAVLVYSFFIALQRHEGGQKMTVEVQASMWSVKLESPFVMAIRDHLGDDITVGALTGLYYYSHQLSGLDAVVGARLKAEGLGRGIMDWPLRQLARTGKDYRMESNSVANTLAHSGEFGSGWLTGFAVLITDFGNIGSIITVALASVLLGAIVRRAIAGVSEVDTLLAIWLLEFFIWAVHYFPADGFHFINMLMVVILYIFQYGTRFRAVITSR